MFAEIVGNNAEIFKVNALSYYTIYDKMMLITGNDHEISQDVASWCELASEGETYTFREGQINIIE